MQAAWWPHTTNQAIASYRLRCARVIAQLRREGVDAGLFGRGIVPQVLVLSKRYDARSVETAVALRSRHGTRLLLDLCDNHFYASDANPAWKERASTLRRAVQAVDLVVTSSDALAAVVRQEVPDKATCVIGDAAELPFEPGPWRRLAHPIAELELAGLRSKLEHGRAVGGRRLVWFGNHGSDYADGGMADLSTLQQILHALHAEAPLSVTVISNNRKKFDALISSWSVPHHYLPWHRSTSSRAMRLHDIALIPIRRNPFTSCKTNNRAATALLHGLGVAADTIPSYEPLADSIVLDDWNGGLRRLMADAVYRRGCVERGAQRIREQWSLEHVTGQWRAALESR